MILFYLMTLSKMKDTEYQSEPKSVALWWCDIGQPHSQIS